MAEPSILGALRDPQFRSDTLRNLVEALNGAKRSLTVGSLGAVGDMGNTLANLVRAGAGTAYHEATGRPIPQALEYRDPARDFGTSASLGNFAEQQGWLPPQTYSMPEQAGALLGPIVAMKAPDLAQSTLRGLVSALKSEPSRRMVEGLVDGMGARPKIFAGEGAQTADMQALAKAQQLEKAGAPERAIWSDTGWFRGADKKWRFEIDDSGASFIDKGFTTLPQGSVTSKNVNLGKQVDHQGLFEAYPKAAKMDAVITTNRGTGTGSYSNGLIEANGPNKSQAMGTTLHEIQHGIQDVEGFAKGGNSQMAYLNKEAFEVLADVRKRLSAPLSLDQYAKSAGFSSPTEASASYADYVASMKKAPPAWLEHEIQRSAANEFYQRLAGEAEARAVQSRMDMTPEQRRATFPFDSYDVPRDSLIIRK
jgi:hypothetical protein